MTSLTVVDRAQGDAILELIRWFDNQSSSLHHALVMAAERNTEDAASVEAEAPAVARVLRESAESWRKHATEVLTLTEKLGERIGEVDDLNIHPY